MSWNSIVSGTTSLEPTRLGDAVEALVGDADDRDVRLDRREGVVAGLGAGAA